MDEKPPFSDWPDLERTLEFLLPRVAFPLPGKRRELFDQWARLTAKALVEGLRERNWRITKGPPMRPYSIACNPPRD